MLSCLKRLEYFEFPANMKYFRICSSLILEVGADPGQRPASPGINQVLEFYPIFLLCKGKKTIFAGLLSCPSPSLASGRTSWTWRPRPPSSSPLLAGLTSLLWRSKLLPCRHWPSHSPRGRLPRPYKVALLPVGSGLVLFPPPSPQ